MPGSKLLVAFYLPHRWSVLMMQTPPLAAPTAAALEFNWYVPCKAAFQISAQIVGSAGCCDVVPDALT